MTRCIHSEADKQGFSSKLSILSSELELYSESESSAECFLKQFKIILNRHFHQNKIILKYFLMTTVMHAANFLDLLSFCKREISTQISNTYVQIGQFWRRNTMELKNLWNYTYLYYFEKTNEWSISRNVLVTKVRSCYLVSIQSNPAANFFL